MLEKFCFINKDLEIKIIQSDSFENINITNKYCKYFPCVLSLEKDIKDIPDTSCKNIKNSYIYHSCNNNDEGMVFYNGEKIQKIKGRWLDSVCTFIEKWNNNKKLINIKNIITNSNYTYYNATKYTTKTININNTKGYNLTINITKTLIPSPIVKTHNRTFTNYINNTIYKINCNNTKNSSDNFNITKTHNKTFTNYINSTIIKNQSKINFNNIQSIDSDKINFIKEINNNKHLETCLNSVYGNNSLQNNIEYLLQDV